MTHPQTSIPNAPSREPVQSPGVNELLLSLMSMVFANGQISDSNISQAVQSTPSQNSESSHQFVSTDSSSFQVQSNPLNAHALHPPNPPLHRPHQIGLIPYWPSNDTVQQQQNVKQVNALNQRIEAPPNRTIDLNAAFQPFLGLLTSSFFQSLPIEQKMYLCNQIILIYDQTNEKNVNNPTAASDKIDRDDSDGNIQRGSL
jgi:hypothetical protein